MARTHARLMCAIWNDPDYTSMNMGPQWLYEHLMSQGAINRAGVLSLTVRRWARGAQDVTVQDVEHYLRQLVDGGFVLTDEDTEEVLVRSFIRHDGIADQPNMLKAALNDARQIASPALRAALAAELRRLPAKRPDTTRMSYPDPHAVADDIDPGPEDPPPGKPSDKATGEPSVKASTEGGYELFTNAPANPSVEVCETHPGTLPETPGDWDRDGDRESSHLPDNSSSKKNTAPRTDAELMDGFDEFYTAFPRRKDRLKAEKAWRAARRRGVPAERLIQGSKRYAVETARTEARYVLYPASWLNGGSYDNEPDVSRPRLQAVSGGYVPWQNPASDDDYDTDLLPGGDSG
jgi:hypothetical protein